MRKTGKNNAPDVPGFIKAEVYKVFQQFPNRNFNYKQLGKIIKPAYILFLSDVVGESHEPADIHLELKKEIAILLDDLRHKEEIIEVSRGTYKLKPIHSYQEGFIDITST